MTIKELEKICREACLSGKGDLEVVIVNKEKILHIRKHEFGQVSDMLIDRLYYTLSLLAN